MTKIETFQDRAGEFRLAPQRCQRRDHRWEQGLQE